MYINIYYSFIHMYIFAYECMNIYTVLTSYSFTYSICASNEFAYYLTKLIPETYPKYIYLRFE